MPRVAANGARSAASKTGALGTAHHGDSRRPSAVSPEASTAERLGHRDERRRHAVERRPVGCERRDSGALGFQPGGHHGGRGSGRPVFASDDQGVEVDVAGVAGVRRHLHELRADFGDRRADCEGSESAGCHPQGELRAEGELFELPQPAQGAARCVDERLRALQDSLPQHGVVARRGGHELAVLPDQACVERDEGLAVDGFATRTVRQVGSELPQGRIAEHAGEQAPVRRRAVADVGAAGRDPVPSGCRRRSDDRVRLIPTLFEIELATILLDRADLVLGGFADAAASEPRADSSDEARESVFAAPARGRRGGRLHAARGFEHADDGLGVGLEIEDGAVAEAVGRHVAHRAERPIDRHVVGHSAVDDPERPRAPVDSVALKVEGELHVDWFVCRDRSLTGLQGGRRRRPDERRLEGARKGGGRSGRVRQPSEVGVVLAACVAERPAIRLLLRQRSHLPGRDRAPELAVGRVGVADEMEVPALFLRPDLGEVLVVDDRRRQVDDDAICDVIGVARPCRRWYGGHVRPAARSTRRP